MNCVNSVIKVQEQRKNILEKEMLLSIRSQAGNGTDRVTAAPAPEDRGNGRDRRNRRDRGVAGSPERAPSVRSETPAAKGGGKGGKKQEDKGSSLSQLVDKDRPATKLPCFFFHNGKSCKNGDQCKFSHDPIPDLETKTFDKRGTSCEALLRFLAQWHLHKRRMQISSPQREGDR